MASQHWKEVLLSLSGSLAEDIVEEMQEVSFKVRSTLKGPT